MFEKEIEWIIGAFKLVAIGAILIYVAYKIIEILIPEVPIYLRLILLGILGIFVYAVRDKIKKNYRTLISLISVFL
jgi:hypothetical protein